MPLTKEKNLRRIVIDKLYNNNDHPMKQSTRSNAPTESTPNQPKDLSKAIQTFFQNFQGECAIIYQPVKLKNHKPLKRSLQAEMNCLYQNGAKAICRDDEQIMIGSSIKLSRNASKGKINVEKNFGRERMGCRGKDIEVKVICGRGASLKENKFQHIKTQSVQPKPRSPIHHKNPSRQKPLLFQDINNLSLRQSTKSLKIDHLNLNPYIQKSTINLQRQIVDQYMTNSKNSYERLMQKNAPRKQPEKQQRVDRMKRAQSLKSLNENGIRKYSYRRQHP